jgi:spermidine/putrescine transport system substrate-binding protein
MTRSTRRRQFLASAGAAAIGVAAGCTGGGSGDGSDSGSGSGSGYGGTTGDAGDGGGTLRILDWNYVYADGILEEFEEAHDCTVELQAAESSARNLSLLRSGRSNHDIVALGNYAVPPAMDEGLIRPIDLDRVPAYEDVFEFVKKDYFTSDGRTYGVPRSFGQTPMAVNTDAVDETPESWMALWDETLDGRIGGRDDARLQFLYARAAHGIDPLNPTSGADVDFDEMRDLLAEHVSLAGGFWSGGDAASLMKNEQVAVQPVWNYVLVSLRNDGFPVERVYPEEGTKAWFLQHTVRADAENVDLAHTFMQEWQTTYGYRSLMEPSNIAVPNERVFDEHDVALSEFGIDDPDQFIYEDPKSQDLISQYQRTWTEAKNRA